MVAVYAYKMGRVNSVCPDRLLICHINYLGGFGFGLGFGCFKVEAQMAAMPENE